MPHIIPELYIAPGYISEAVYFRSEISTFAAFTEATVLLR
jgi:hypothetical protein